MTRADTRAKAVAILAEVGLTPEDIAAVMTIGHLCEAGLAVVALDSVECELLGKIAKRHGDVPLLTLDATGSPIPPAVIGDPVATKVRALYAREVVRRAARGLKPRAFVSFEKQAHREFSL